MINEIWKNINGYPNYQVSNLGRVKSLEKMINHGNYIGLSAEKLLTLKNHKFGYLFVSLSKDGVKKQFLIHRLVADSFIKNDLNKKQVNHKNGIKTDNNINNLEWVTVSENHIHAFRVLNKQHPRHQLGKTGALCAHAKKVYCPTIGMTFSSLKEASVLLGLNKKKISHSCYNKISHVEGFVFNYL